MRSLGIAAGMAALGTALIGVGATGASHGRAVVRRVAGNTKRGRQMVSVKTIHSRNKYVPHIGAKEQERAKRCYMVNTFGAPANPHNASPRPTPTLAQAARLYPF